MAKLSGKNCSLKLRASTEKLQKCVKKTKKETRLENFTITVYTIH